MTIISREDLKDNDEDVGELKGTGCMPVFETFVEFLKVNGYEDLLSKGFEEMEKQSKKENETIHKSKVWEDLTKQAKEESTGFSFGFGFEDDAE